MDFWLALKVLWRRWYIAVPAAILAVLLALATYTTIDTRYESTAVLVLTSPTEGGTYSPGTRPEDVRRVNPLLAFDGSLTTSAQIIIQILRDPRTAEEIGVLPDSKDTFEVNNGNFGGSGPFISVLGTTNSFERSTELTDRVMNRAIDELAERQVELGAPESTLITAQILVRPTEAESLIGGKVRFAGAMFLVGVIAALAAPFAFESLMQARAARRAARPEGESADADLPGPASDPEPNARPPAQLPPGPRTPTAAGGEASMRIPVTVPRGNGNGNGTSGSNGDRGSNG